MRIAQLSDLHLRPGVLHSGIDPWAHLRDAFARLAELQPPPDFLLITGDLADNGGLDTYRELAMALAESGIPFALLPGNHDAREPLRAASPELYAECGNRLDYRVDRGELSLLLLDTLKPGSEAGELLPAQIDWLSAICPTKRRVILAMHHPPLPVGIAGMDAIGCQGGEQLEAWLAAHPQVEAVLCGHVHRSVTTRIGSTLLLTCPSTVHQIALQDGPLAWTSEPAGMLIHDLLPGLPMRSHLLPLAAAPIHCYGERVT